VNTTRTVGLVLAAVATGLWAVVVLGFLLTGPEDGVNIGAAMLGLVALPLSVGASVTLIVSRGDAARHGVAEEHPLARRIAAGLGVASIAFLGGSTVLGELDSLALAAVAVVLLTAGITAFVASSALFALPRSPRT
jgi:hypothetical protein